MLVKFLAVTASEFVVQSVSQVLYLSAVHLNAAKSLALKVGWQLSLERDASSVLDTDLDLNPVGLFQFSDHKDVKICRDIIPKSLRPLKAIAQVERVSRFECFSASRF